MKKLLFIAVVVILTIVAAVFAMNRTAESPSMTQDNTQSSHSERTEDTEDTELSEHLRGANVRETVDATNQKEVAVEIDDFYFSPTILTVSKGTVVTWTNNGRLGHTVTSADDSPKQGLDSELLNTGDTYSFTFDETGTYNYICAPHPSNMRAIVNVVE